MVKAGLYKPGEVDLSKVVTTQFVNKKVGLDVKQKLGGEPRFSVQGRADLGADGAAERHTG